MFDDPEKERKFNSACPTSLPKICLGEASCYKEKSLKNTLLDMDNLFVDSPKSTKIFVDFGESTKIFVDFGKIYEDFRRFLARKLRKYLRRSS